MSSCFRGGLRHWRTKDHPDGSFSALWDGADWGSVPIHLHGCAALHRNTAETHRGGAGVFALSLSPGSPSFSSPLTVLPCLCLCRRVRAKGASTPTLSTLCLTWLGASRVLCLLALPFPPPPAQSKQCGQDADSVSFHIKQCWKCVGSYWWLCVCVQDEGGQLQSVWERGFDAAAEELQMRLTFDPSALIVSGKQHPLRLVSTFEGNKLNQSNTEYTDDCKNNRRICYNFLCFPDCVYVHKSAILRSSLIPVSCRTSIPDSFFLPDTPWRLRLRPQWHGTMENKAKYESQRPGARLLLLSLILHELLPSRWILNHCDHQTSLWEAWCAKTLWNHVLGLV